MKYHHKTAGFLLLESCLALIVLTLVAHLLLISVGETRKIKNIQELRVDRAYVAYVFKKTACSRLLVHDHWYHKETSNSIYDETVDRRYEIKN